MDNIHTICQCRTPKRAKVEDRLARIVSRVIDVFLICPYQCFGAVNASSVVAWHPFPGEHVIAAGTLELFELRFQDSRSVDTPDPTKE